MRQRYVKVLHARLPVGCSGLLITLEYPQSQMEGSPLSVDELEVRSLYRPTLSVDLPDRRDILAREPRFREDGVTALSTAIYRLRHASKA